MDTTGDGMPPGTAWGCNTGSLMTSTPHILVVNGVKVRQPVFVLGAPHSGTELLASAIKRSPGIHLTFGRPGVLRTIYAFARQPSFAADRGEGSARVLRDAYAHAWQITPDGCAECPLECRELGDHITSGTCVPENGVERFGDATPDLIYSADVLRAAFPDARLLQIIRDGRDVVADMVNDQRCLAWFRPGMDNVDEVFPNPFFGVDTGEERAHWHSAGPTVKCALRWRGTVRLSARLHADTPADQLRTVRFEDMVADPAGTLAQISDYLRHPLAKGGLTVRPGDIGRGRAALTAKQIGVVERVAGEELRRLGYLTA
jgi:hypothetical protein